jgi:hypothetical protein
MEILYHRSILLPWIFGCEGCEIVVFSAESWEVNERGGEICNP